LFSLQYIYTEKAFSSSKQQYCFFYSIKNKNINIKESLSIVLFAIIIHNAIDFREQIHQDVEKEKKN
jgi:hypothetical protein